MRFSSRVKKTFRDYHYFREFFWVAEMQREWSLLSVFARETPYRVRRNKWGETLSSFATKGHVSIRNKKKKKDRGKKANPLMS